MAHREVGRMVVALFYTNKLWEYSEDIDADDNIPCWKNTFKRLEALWRMVAGFD